MAALDWLDKNGGNLVGVGADPFERLRSAVFKHRHVCDGIARNARCQRRRRWLSSALEPLDEHFVKHAVVVTREEDDAVLSADRTGDAHCSHDRFGAGVAECGALVAGHLAERLGDLAREEGLRADLEAEVKLLFDGLFDKVWPVAKHDGAEAVQAVDVLVAVDVPEARSLGAVGDDRVDHLLPLDFEASDDARVGEMWTELLRLGFRLAGAAGVERDEIADMLFLLRRQLARDLLRRGAEGNVALELNRSGIFRSFN